MILIGGGAPEAECAMRLTLWSKTLTGVRSYCVRAFAEVCIWLHIWLMPCFIFAHSFFFFLFYIIIFLSFFYQYQALEIIPYTLAENAGINPIQMVTELRNRHSEGVSSAGINVRQGVVTDMWAEKVVQPLLVNTSEISLATECVGMILKIGEKQIIINSCYFECCFSC